MDNPKPNEELHFVDRTRPQGHSVQVPAIVIAFLVLVLMVVICSNTIFPHWLEYLNGLL